MSPSSQSNSLFRVGDIVLVPFPGFAGAVPKRRPTVVLASVSYGTSYDYLVCLITSQPAPDPLRITLSPNAVIGGTLTAPSYLRPAYLYTVSERLIRSIGTLSTARLTEAIETVVTLLQPQQPL